MWWPILEHLRNYWYAYLGGIICLSLAVSMVQEIQFKHKQIVFTRMAQGLLTLILCAVLYAFYIALTMFI